MAKPEQAEKVENRIEVFKNPKEYEKALQKLTKDGWVQLEVTNRQPRSGIGRILAIGIFAAIFKPKPELVVTLERRTLNKGYVRCFACSTINRENKKDPTQACTSCGAQLRA